jgi:hypothetical protein
MDIILYPLLSLEHKATIFTLFYVIEEDIYSYLRLIGKYMERDSPAPLLFTHYTKKGRNING